MCPGCRIVITVLILTALLLLLLLIIILLLHLQPSIMGFRGLLGAA